MQYLKIGLICMLVLLTGFNAMAQPGQKQDVKVLYVGSPTEEKGARFPAFSNYLELYFTEVKAIDAKAYKTEMSADYDVTIFDAPITPFKQTIRERREDGTMHYEPAAYLTEDFDDAVVFIGQAAPMMGKTIGLKLDWLCLCLDSEAHHIKTDHPIFKGPFDVELTLVEKPTPENLFLSESGQNLPKEIPMWRVQSEVWAEDGGKNFRIGMVSRRGGFLDSPDTEYISGGVNSKADPEAVAIGRHGNFLMWGFTGSPNHMTDEAKQVFANAVVYMKQFKGKKPVARKYKEQIPVRDPVVDNMIFRVSKEAYQSWLNYLEKSNNRVKRRYELLIEKKENGEELTDGEKRAISIKPQPRPLPDWENYIRDKMSSYGFFKEEYVDNIEAYKNFLRENREYMYAPAGGRLLKIDDDAKQLGISNRDIKILYKAVELLEKGQQSDLATRILNRYTKERFSSPKEWKQWLKKNKKHLFFTDAGGYVWLVNKIGK